MAGRSVDGRAESLDGALSGADVAVIVTAHPGLEQVPCEARLMVDFRGVTRGIEAPNLVRL